MISDRGKEKEVDKQPGISECENFPFSVKQKNK